MTKHQANRRNNDNNKPVKWDSPYKKHFVLYMDIMGFKNIISTTQHKKLQELMMKFIDGLNSGTQPLVNPYLRMTRFSDSILFVTEDTTEQSFKNLTLLAVRVMHYGLKNKFPIRGCIALGNLTYDEINQLIFGKALVDAYLLEEEILHYGVVVHHTAEAAARQYNAKNPKNNPLYFETIIAMKQGKFPHHQLAWHRLNYNLDTGNITNEALKLLDQIQQTVSCRPRMYIENTRRMITEINHIIDTPTISKGNA